MTWCYSILNRGEEDWFSLLKIPNRCEDASHLCLYHPGMKLSRSCLPHRSNTILDISDPLGRDYVLIHWPLKIKWRCLICWDHLGSLSDQSCSVYVGSPHLCSAGTVFLFGVNNGWFSFLKNGVLGIEPSVLCKDYSITSALSPLSFSLLCMSICNTPEVARI